jgi:subtilase family serine protease
VVALLGSALLGSVALAACGGDDDDTGGAAPTTAPPPASTAPKQLPDFVIVDVAVDPDVPLVPPGDVTITATVRNAGSADYPNAIVVRAPGNHTGVIAGGLAAGATGEADITFPVVSPNAEYRMTLVVDPDDVTPESNEANNESRELLIRTSP